MAEYVRLSYSLQKLQITDILNIFLKNPNKSPMTCLRL